MEKQKVLFVCIHNSARSQMAEAYLNKFGGEWFEAESAGIEPGKLNPTVIKVLQKQGIDISGKSTNDVFDFFKKGRIFTHVITVCDKEAAEACPYYPGVTNRINWSFPDPSSFNGSEGEKLEFTRKVSEEIKEAILTFIEDYKEFNR